MADAPTKPSFIQSVLSGIAGYTKGLLTGGVTGAVVGALAGAIVGIFTGGIGTAALVGALYAGTAMAMVGAAAGTVTGVIKSREVAQPSANDVVNVAKATFQQGVMVGQQMAQGQSTTFRDRIAQERAALVVNQHIH